MSNYGIKKLNRPEESFKIHGPHAAAHIVHGLAKGRGSVKAGAVTMGKNILFGTNVMEQIAKRSAQLKARRVKRAVK